MLKSLFLTAVFGLCASALPITSTSSPTDLVVRDNWDVTRNDLVNGVCGPVTIIFARGTLELGNVGSLAGPPFFNALADTIGSQNVAVQGVDYGATVAGYLEGGDPAGAATLASLVNLAVSQCPSTQIVLSGYRYVCPVLATGDGMLTCVLYSQGAQVVHLGVKQISAAAASHVSAVVFFGDPDDGQALQNIAANEDDTYCFATDLICAGLPIVLPAHLSYSVDALPGALFVAGLVHV